MSKASRKHKSKSIGRRRSTQRLFACINTVRHCHDSKRRLLDYNKTSAEPPDHAIGRSRGGLTTKTHLVCDGKGRPLSFVVTGGQVADTIMLPTTMDQIRVLTAGWPRRRPERLRADKGYPSKSNRACLRARDVRTTIPERDDQIAHRRKRPGHPIVFDAVDHKGRNVVERCFTDLSNGAALRCAPTRPLGTTPPRSVLQRPFSGSPPSQKAKTERSQSCFRILTVVVSYPTDSYSPRAASL